jgi:hypothetical protein
MRILIANAAANSPTCYVREADANLLNLLPFSRRVFLQSFNSKLNSKLVSL